MMMQRFWKKNKGLMLALAAVVAAVAGLLWCYAQFRPRAEIGLKRISVEVVYEDGSAESYDIETKQEYLEQAFADAKGLTVEGSRTEQFGLMIETVNGVTAIYDKNQAYWFLEVDGEACSYGVSTQAIRDGEHYRLVYTAAGAP